MQKHRFQFNSFVIIFAFILFAVILTYLVPAGNYERSLNSEGQEVVQADSFSYRENTPVGLMEAFSCISEAFVSSEDIIFCIFFASVFVATLMECGAIPALFSKIVRTLNRRAQWMIPMVILCFAQMGSAAGIAEETFGMFPICISLAIALGYDRIVGGAIVYLAVFTGFAAATFNPYTIGVAQAIAGVPLYSGVEFRLMCFVVFVGILIVYTMRYAAKIKKDPAKSLMYGLEKETAAVSNEEHFNGRKGVSIAVFFAVLFLAVFGAIRWGWYLNEIMALFLIGTIAVGLVNGWAPGKIADGLVENGSSALFSMLIIGFSNAISGVLVHGNVIDTIVHGMASLLEGTSGYASAVLMLVIQNLLNFFIPSGPGQAAVFMPIMTSFADVTGLSRQVAVLAFQFGDGFSNIFWPTMVFMMCGILKVPVGRWYRFVTPLFGIMFVVQVLLLCLAVGIGY